MANVFDEYADERDRETALKLLQEGAPVEMISNAMSSLSKEFIQQLKDQLEIKPAI